MEHSKRMQTLEEGLKLVGLLTPESREKIVQAFLAQEAQMVQQQTEITQLSNEVARLQERIDRVQHYITEAGRKY